MSAEHLERTRIRKAKEALAAKASDARNQINRFFGAKICGACEGCSGGTCDNCKGKPVVSLWEAANSAPALEDASAALPGIQVSPQEKSRPDLAKIAFQPAAQRTESGTPGTSQNEEDSRLIHFRAPKSADAQLPSGASLIRSGLMDEAPETAGQATRPEAVSKEACTPRKETAFVKPALIALEVKSGGTGSSVRISSRTQIPAGSWQKTPALEREEPHAERIVAPEPERMVKIQGPVAEVPALGPALEKAGITILENPCMQAILKMKYPRRERARPAVSQPSGDDMESEAPLLIRAEKKSPAHAIKAERKAERSRDGRRKAAPGLEARQEELKPNDRLPEKTSVKPLGRGGFAKGPGENASVRKEKRGSRLPEKQDVTESRGIKARGRAGPGKTPLKERIRSKRLKEAARLIFLLELLSRRRKRKRGAGIRLKKTL